MLCDLESRNLYETIMSTIKGCIHPASYEELVTPKHILIIAISEERIIRNFFARMEACGADIEVTVIAQPKMVPILSPYIGDRASILEWNGVYTVEVVNKVHSEISRPIDAFVFFSSQKMDVRNLNLLEIANAFQEDIKVFGMDFDGELQQYVQVDLLLQAVRVYFDIDKYIRLKLVNDDADIIS